MSSIKDLDIKRERVLPLLQKAVISLSENGEVKRIDNNLDDNTNYSCDISGKTAIVRVIYKESGYITLVYKQGRYPELSEKICRKLVELSEDDEFIDYDRAVSKRLEQFKEITDLTKYLDGNVKIFAAASDIMGIRLSSLFVIALTYDPDLEEQCQNPFVLFGCVNSYLDQIFDRLKVKQSDIDFLYSHIADYEVIVSDSSVSETVFKSNVLFKLIHELFFLYRSIFGYRHIEYQNFLKGVYHPIEKIERYFLKCVNLVEKIAIAVRVIEQLE